ncbi:MAG: hypothetical protein NXH85_03205 [Pseudomonadaceae bacterium]|nr:hypothetical protein [Pseudomonadaceae bacterium]
MSNKPPVLSRHQLGEPETLARLDRACREWGVFYLADHGLDQRDALFAQASAFFNEAPAHKNQVRRSEHNAWGFFDEELTKNTRDWKEIFDVGPEGVYGVPQWPACTPGLQQACESHFADCHSLSIELLNAVSENLGVEGSTLAHAFEPDHSSFLRLNYFPTCNDNAAPSGLNVPDDGYLGVNHHTDAGALTLLLTDDVPGLEVYVRGQWHSLPPVAGALIVNLGDVVQVWSNDRYVAPIHRVRSQSNRVRMSMPFFFNPAASVDYAPLASVVSAANPARYRAINFGEFRQLRAAGDYADGGEEVQIDQYRVG